MATFRGFNGEGLLPKQGIAADNQKFELLKISNNIGTIFEICDFCSIQYLTILKTV
jgi:hypothetical protein